MNKELDIYLPNFYITCDFIKENEKYIPAKININHESLVKYKSTNYPFNAMNEFIFRSHKLSKTKGITNKIDLSKSIIDNIPTTKTKENKTLLSM